MESKATVASMNQAYGSCFQGKNSEFANRTCRDFILLMKGCLFHASYSVKCDISMQKHFCGNSIDLYEL